MPQLPGKLAAQQNRPVLGRGIRPAECCQKAGHAFSARPQAAPRHGRQQTVPGDEGTGHQPHAQPGRGQGRAARKVCVQKPAQRVRQGRAHGWVLHQYHSPARERLLHRKAGVAKGLHRHRAAVQLQRGRKAAALRPPEAQQHPAQRRVHGPAGRQKPPGRQGQVQAQVGAAGPGQGRCAATEILVGTDAVANLIREGKCYQIPSILQSGAALGMHSLNADLARLVATGRITREAAERCATDKSDLRNYL